MRASSSLIPGLALVLSVSASAACGGAKKYEEDPHWASRDTITTEDDASAFIDSAAPQIADVNFDWVGVRPDLAIARTQPRKANCSCLSVEIGQPFDSKFVWEGGSPPKISGNKMAVAVSAFGIECPGGPQDQAERRPSIRAVDRKGNDVVIEIEDISVDRPVASGAIFNPPGAGGAIYLRPRTARLPYARPSSGSLCRVQ